LEGDDDEEKDESLVRRRKVGGVGAAGEEEESLVDFVRKHVEQKVRKSYLFDRTMPVE
jgi:hypothetical protein